MSACPCFRKSHFSIKELHFLVFISRLIISMNVEGYTWNTNLNSAYEPLQVEAPFLSSYLNLKIDSELSFSYGKLCFGKIYSYKDYT